MSYYGSSVWDRLEGGQTWGWVDPFIILLQSIVEAKSIEGLNYYSPGRMEKRAHVRET